MSEMRKGQMLEVENLMSFRGKISQNELETMGKELEAKVNLAGAKRVSNPITVTYGVEGNTLDIELLLPINKKIDNIDRYCYKEKLKIVNAVMAKHKGNPIGLQDTCNELNQYILENKLVPITAGYNVTKKIDSMNIDNTEIDVYVGISPNIL